MLSNLKSKCVVIGSAVSGTFLTASMALATESSITVPDVDTSILSDAGTAILAAVATACAIGIGIRLFKRG